MTRHDTITLIAIVTLGVLSIIAIGASGYSQAAREREEARAEVAALRVQLAGPAAPCAPAPSPKKRYLEADLGDSSTILYAGDGRGVTTVKPSSTGLWTVLRESVERRPAVSAPAPTGVPRRTRSSLIDEP